MADETNALITMSPKGDVGIEELAAVCAGVMDVFQSQPGFVRGSVLRTTEGTERVVTHLLCRSLADHRACKRSAAFGKSAAGRRWGELLSRLGHEAQVCAVVRESP